MLILHLVCIIFLTVFERNFLRLVQLRLGPNKVGFKGLLQPVSDAIKLLSKEFIYIEKRNFIYYNIQPIIILLFTFLLWIIYPSRRFNNLYLDYGILYILVIISVHIYPLILSGWISNRNYSILGSLRSIAQSISYEVRLFLILFSLLLIIESYSLFDFDKYQKYCNFFIIINPLYCIFLVSLIVELNRAPFDLIEGESELVSGFNVEYSSRIFTIIFIGEYLRILFACLIITIIFFGCNLFRFIFILIYIIHIFFIIGFRAICPRLRYDQLISLCWKRFLPISLCYAIINFSIKEVIIITI